VDLAFTPEQEELVRTLRAFAKKELQPRSAQWDKRGEFPWDTYRQMAALGLLGLRTPAAYGGQEADLLTFGIAMEEIARGDFGCTYGMQLAGLAGEILGRNASEEIQARWLPANARGEAVIAIALTEPGVGSDAANLACRAERHGDEYVINGEKSGISLGMGPSIRRPRSDGLWPVADGLCPVASCGLTDLLLSGAKKAGRASPAPLSGVGCPRPTRGRGGAGASRSRPRRRARRGAPCLPGTASRRPSGRSGALPG
jgi:hypothetical protein